MAKPEWTADIEIDAILARSLVASQFPELAPVTAVPFGQGWDNAAFLVNGCIVFRFPRRRVAAPLIERESAILPQVAARLPLAVSDPVYQGVPSAEYPWPFAGYRMIAGTTACSATLSHAARLALAEPLARFLRDLHRIDPAPLVARGLPPDEIGRFDHVKCLARTVTRTATLVAGELRDAAIFTTWLANHPPEQIPAAGRRFVHGDLYARHVVLDRLLQPAGIIDWGDMHLGDPAIDIAVAHLLLPPEAHADFRTAYGALDERTWNAARYRAIYSAILQTDYGVREVDRGMLDAGKAALEFIREGLGQAA